MLCILVLAYNFLVFANINEVIVWVKKYNFSKSELERVSLLQAYYEFLRVTCRCASVILIFFTDSF
jgi:hypothetical protein